MGVRAMDVQTKERWLELCERAAVEQDAEKLVAIIHEIERLLEEKESRLRGTHVTGGS
jgi:hypothetical protein